MKNIVQEQKAITLIALVITIVVMLILAGVTINLTLGENGIFRTAQQAAKNYTDAQNKEMEYLEGFTNEVNNIVNPAPLGTIIKTENNINYIADGAGNMIPVPVGFSPITTSDQGTKYTGFVIKNDTDGNEFVWVPVKGMGYEYNRYAMLTRQPVDVLDEETQSMKIRYNSEYYFTEAMPQEEQESVATYGGYYIGRYETGIKDYTSKSTTSGGATWTGYTGGTLIIETNQEVWNYITRDRAKMEAESLYNKEKNNVTSRLCSSYAWDVALKFIETQNSIYPTNSVGGNYNVESGGTRALQKTGYDKTHACNIYDMGGNVCEWTTEYFSHTSILCTIRGGDYSSNAGGSPAAFRNNNSNYDASARIGFRITLYM